MANEMDRVVPLDELDDYKVASGDPDVRGWEVYASDGRKIGEVDNLLIDTGAMKVRYLDVDLDDELIGSSDDRHILIPIGYAQLNEDDDRIRVDSLNSTDIAAMPEYRHEAITREYETDLRHRYDTATSASAGATGLTGTAATGATGATGSPSGSDFYGGSQYDENRFYGSRRGRAAEGTLAGEQERTVDRRVLPDDGMVAGGAGSAEQDRIQADPARGPADVRREGDVDFRDER